MTRPRIRSIRYVGELTWILLPLALALPLFACALDAGDEQPEAVRGNSWQIQGLMHDDGR